MKDADTYPLATRSLLTRTLWRIETRLAGRLSLEALAEWDGTSPFHLSRAFSLAVGQPLMTYVKARRLSVAARRLQREDARIIEVALDAGYESHEGFSRAFRDYFGCTPRAVRAGTNFTLTFQDAFKMPDIENKALSPRFEERQELRLVGMNRRVSPATMSEIPKHWQDTAAEIGSAMYGIETYGVCHSFDDGDFTYLVGLRDDGRVDTERLDHLVLPAGTYAVFDHDAHISSIHETWTSIFETWLPGADVTSTAGPEFELYDANFDVEKPGGVSIWIPVHPKA